MLKAADIDAKYGVQVDKAMIQGLWGAVRQPPEGSPAEGNGGGAPQGPGAETSTAPPPGPLKPPGGELTVGQGMPNGLLDGGPPTGGPPNPAGALPGG
jgi:hypothetical protein